jgi:peptidylprolyl isomerase
MVLDTCHTGCRSSKRQIIFGSYAERTQGHSKERVMAQAKSGDKVKVHYSGKLANGELFDSSLEREPIEFTIGEEKLIRGFESAVIGMCEGESKTILIPSGEAYGRHQQELVAVVDRKTLPANITPEIGMRLKIDSAQGYPIHLTVMAVTEENVTLDANHPLAGKDLSFEIRLLQIS